MSDLNLSYEQMLRLELMRLLLPLHYGDAEEAIKAGCMVEAFVLAGVTDPAGKLVSNPDFGIDVRAWFTSMMETKRASPRTDAPSR